MSNGLRKKIKEIKAIITDMGFECRGIEVGHAGHLCCHITDDMGYEFRAWTGCSCSANVKRARMNFRSDIRKLSNTAKGLIN